VTLAQENQGSKHGLILLVQDPEANFKTATPPAQPAVPLTEPELRAVLEKTNHMITNTMCGPFWPELEQACRAIEAAHGITKGQP
jgi:hypothetical protein